MSKKRQICLKEIISSFSPRIRNSYSSPHLLVIKNSGQHKNEANTRLKHANTGWPNNTFALALAKCWDSETWMKSRGPIEVGLVTYNTRWYIDFNSRALHSRGVSAIDPTIPIFTRSSFIQVDLGTGSIFWKYVALTYWRTKLLVFDW